MLKHFTEKELNDIIKDYNSGDGLKPHELAEKYKRNSSSIINKLKSLGIYKNSHYRFSKDDIQYLKEKYSTASWDEILNRFPNLTKNSILKKVSTLGIKRETNTWTEEEINLIKQYYDCSNISKLCELLPNRTYSSIVSKAEKIGLKVREFWSNDENELLKKVYPNVPMEDVVKEFPHRSKGAIINHAISLNLKSFDYIPWTQQEDNYIRLNWKLTPDIIMAQTLQRTLRATKYRRETLGLYRRDMNSTTYTTLSKFVRGKLQDWKKQSMKIHDYKCIFTGSKDFEIHHLYGVSNILTDVFNKYKIVQRDFDQYTQDELNYILEKFLYEQNLHPLGVCISKKIHILFHSLYGQYYNTPEQWYQFEKDYRSGIYEVILKKKK